MNGDIQKEIEQRMAELPQDVRAAIQSNDFEKRVGDIGTKHNLHIDQVGALGDEVMLVMLGFADASQFQANITAQVKVSPEEAAAIAGAVNEQLFLPIRESMKQFMASHHSQSAMPAPRSSPATVASVSAPAPIPQSAQKSPAVFPMAEKLLTEKTIVVPQQLTTPPSQAASASKPIYKADPYREPIE